MSPEDLGPRPLKLRDDGGEHHLLPTLQFSLSLGCEDVLKLECGADHTRSIPQGTALAPTYTDHTSSYCIHLQHLIFVTQNNPERLKGKND